MKLIIFTLSNARSGTLYLRYLFQNNVNGCVTRHEPFLDWGNPTMFGRAIYDAYAGRVDCLRQLLLKKRRYIDRLPGKIYLESSHAFLKSAYLAAMEIFPEMRLIHLIRNPLEVARSAAYRHRWRERAHAPLHFYKGPDNRRHFVWALTGNEGVFQHFDRPRLSLFQWYLLEWIEIENRAIHFLEQCQLEPHCFTLHSPADLNDKGKIRAMFEFFGVTTSGLPIRLAGRKNKSLGYSGAIGSEEDRQCAEILRQLPPKYLEIFQHQPYLSLPWSERFRNSSREAEQAVQPSATLVPAA